MQQHPGAKVLVHPESPQSVVVQADVVGSTTQILNAVLKSDAQTFIIATDKPDLYTLTRGLAQLTSGGLGSGKQFPISMAAALLMTIPTAIVFMVFQRHFTQGANAGAEKG